MKLKPWVAFGALLAAVHGAHAAQPPHASGPADPADPAAAVPPVVHASALAGYTPAAKEGQPSPDKAWRAANDALSGQPGAAGHHAGQHVQAPAPRQDEAQRPVAPAAPAKAHDHHKHH